jgi:hypothetical protein
MCTSSNKQAFWRWRFPNMGIEGVELRKTDKRQKSYITNDTYVAEFHKKRKMYTSSVADK